MKISPVKSPSFGEYIINNNNQTAIQKKVINCISRNEALTNDLVDKLEVNDTDIVVTANPDGKTVNLSLLTTIDFLGQSYTPYRSNGKKYETTITPTIQNKKLNQRNIFMQTALFLKHAEKLDLSTPENTEEVEKITDKAFKEQGLCE